MRNMATKTISFNLLDLLIQTSGQPPASAMGIVCWKTSNIFLQIIWGQKKMIQNWCNLYLIPGYQSLFVGVPPPPLTKKKVDSRSFLRFQIFYQLILNAFKLFFFLEVQVWMLATKICTHRRNVLFLMYIQEFCFRTIPYRCEIQFQFNIYSHNKLTFKFLKNI